MSIKIIHTADCHLGSGRANVSGGKRELMSTFFRILDLCRTEKADFLLIAGDLFDTPFTHRETAEEIAEGFARIKDTEVIIASGNHDCACIDSLYDTYRFPENVTLFTGPMEYRDFPNKQTRIYGAGFTALHESNSLLSDHSVPDTDTINIGVFHGELTNSAQGCLYNPISDRQIFASGFDYMALGHIHMRSEILKSGNTFYAYCGCPDGRGFDETGSKGIYIGTVGKGECNLRYMELSSRKYIEDNVDISGCRSARHAADIITRFIEEKYNDVFSDNLYRITMQGAVDPELALNISQIEGEVNTHVEFCRISDNTSPEPSALHHLASEQTLKGVFARKMLDRINTSPDNEMLTEALRLGLCAFEREVKLYDN